MRRKLGIGSSVAVLVALMMLSAWASVAASAAAGSEQLWTRCNGMAEDATCRLPRGIASAPSTAPVPGALYVVDSGNSRVLRYTAWGDLLGSFGRQVNRTKVEAAAPEAQQNVCPVDLDDVCQAGVPGSGAGQFENPQGVAVDSAGSAYVVDRPNHRVQKFDSEGRFLFMFGKGVNTGTGTNKDICTNVGPPTDICGIGGEGTGPGQFGAWPIIGSYIAIDTNFTPSVADDKVYVGDVGRIQLFDVAGAYQADVPDPEGVLTGRKVGSLAVVPSGSGAPNKGDLIVAFEGVSDVFALEAASGIRRCTAKLVSPTALASDAAGNLYVAAQEPSFDPSTPIRKFGPACGEIGDPTGAGEIESSTGIATGGSCFNNPKKEVDLYVSNSISSNPLVRAYGPFPTNLALCPRPAKSPQIAAQYALSAGTSEALVRAEINPRFWPDATYWVQYGTAACIAQGWEGNACVEQKPAVPLGAGIDGEITTAGVLLHGLVSDTAYRFRFAAESGGGGPVFGEGGEVGEDGSVGGFRTTASHPALVDSCPNRAFRIGGGAALPDCRGYEMVSPIDKEASDIVAGSSLPNGVPVERNQSALSGNALTFTAERRFGDAVSQPAAPQYIATRGETSWTTHGISPPRGVIAGGALAGTDNEFKVFSEDLCRAWLVTDNTTAPPLAPGGLQGSQNVYERSNCGEEGYEALYSGNAEVQGITKDRTVVFRAGGNVWLAGGGEDKPVCVLPDGTSPVFGCSVGTTISAPGGYEGSVEHALAADGSRVFWTAAGNGPGPLFVRENPAEPQSAMSNGAATGTGKLVKGSTEVTNLTVTTGAFEVGQRITGRGIAPGTTIAAVGVASLTLSASATEDRGSQALSAYSECTEPDKACTVPISDVIPAAPFQPRFTTLQSTFLDAAADGSRALFSFDPDKTGLSGGPGEAENLSEPDLYEFEVASRTPRLIAHNTIGLLGASENLERIYLVSTDAISGSGENGELDVAMDGEPNLYLYEAAEESFTFVATLAEADANPNPIAATRFPTSVVPIGHTARVNSSGGVTAFMSIAPITGYDNRSSASGESASEVFRYEAQSDELSCVSCNPTGVRPAAREVEVGSRFEARAVAGQIPAAQHQLYFSRALSENGRRLFFESFDALVLRDINDSKDVYQWEADGEGDCSSTASVSFSTSAKGCVSLVSSGDNERDSSFLDATPSGSDVFFATAASLVAQDPGLIDIYDARVGGGFEPPPPATPPCEGEACQSAPPPPERANFSSAAFRGLGDGAEGRACTSPTLVAKRLAKQSRRLKRAAQRSRNSPRSRALRGAALRLAKRAERLRRSAKRCRARNRATSEGRAER